MRILKRGLESLLLNLRGDIMETYERIATCEHNENIDDILMKVSIDEDLFERIMELSRIVAV